MAKTQQITRKDLHSIYLKVCEGWQTKIAEILVEQQVNEKIEISEELLTKAYSEADPTQKKLLEKSFSISTPKKIIDRIKNWNSILEISGVNEEDIIPWKTPKTKQQKSQNALARIQLITEVYNEGQAFDFRNSIQYKYYPYFEKTAQGWVLGSYIVGILLLVYLRAAILNQVN